MSIKTFPARHSRSGGEQFYPNRDELKFDEVNIFTANSLPIRSGGHVAKKKKTYNENDVKTDFFNPADSYL